MRKGDGEGERESERREDRHEVRGDGTFVTSSFRETGAADAAGCIPVSTRGESSALEHEHAGIRDGSVKAISTWLRGLVAARKLVSTRNLT